MVVIALFSVALAFVAGCATDDDDESDINNETSSTEQDLSSNEHAAFDYFVARGLTKRQSAGIVGNLIQESSVNPKAIEFGGGPGRGIAQWSVGGRWNSSHHDNVTWYAAAHKESRWALHTQLAFTWYELHTVGGYGLSALRKTKTIASRRPRSSATSRSAARAIRRSGSVRDAGLQRVRGQRARGRHR